MSRHRLVQERHRFLALAEILHLCGHHSYLLLNGMENKIVFAGSRFLHTAESRFAPIEGEALAVVYGLESARHFKLGCDNLVVATDHNPLLGVLNNRHLGDIKNERLLSLKEKTLPYRFSIFHIPGQKQKAPEANSRKPTDDAKKLPLHSDFEEPDFIACIKSRLRLPEAP